MFESRNRLVKPALAAALAIIALGGCSASKDGDPYPTPQTENMTAYFSSTSGRLPYPIDLFFVPSAAAPVPDGTLNLPATIPWRGAAMREALNSQDGWGTSTTLTATFSLPLNPATISGSTVKIVKVWLNPKTKGPANPANPTEAALYLPDGATSPVAGPPLVYGTDYTADVAPDIDSEGKTLRITPLKPFDYSRGPTSLGALKVLNVGYIVILTSGLQSESGVSAQSDAEYAGYKTAPADCSTFTGTPALLCQLVKAQIGIGAAVTQTNPADIVLTWGFSTQSMDDTMKMLAASAPTNQTLIVPTGNKTPLGKANVFVGSTVLPYYLKGAANPTDKTPLTSVWQTASGPNPLFELDPNSRNVTMFNPMPAKQGGDVTVPVIVSIPDPATSACPGKPANGWPVAIVMHGITRNRSDAMAIADTLADKCIVVAAIDHLLHGITDPANPLYCTPAKPQCIGASERTFDLDLLNNATGAPAPTGDGVIDPSAAHAINLSSPATFRDQLRQGAADIMAFAKSVPGMAIPPGTPLPAGPVGIDPARIHYVGQSLGAFAGASSLSYVPSVRSATLEAPGGVITVFLFESSYVKDRIYAGLTAAGLAPDTFAFNLFRRDFQSVIDSGDPVNYIKATQAAVPTHVIMWPNDAVVPSAMTEYLIRAADLRRLTDLGPNPVTEGDGAYVLFSSGAHGSIFSPAADPAATAEAQAQTLLFADSVNEPGGPFVVLINPEVLDLD